MPPEIAQQAKKPVVSVRSHFVNSKVESDRRVSCDRNGADAVRFFERSPFKFCGSAHWRFHPAIKLLDTSSFRRTREQTKAD